MSRIISNVRSQSLGSLHFTTLWLNVWILQALAIGLDSWAWCDSYTGGNNHNC